MNKESNNRSRDKNETKNQECDFKEVSEQLLHKLFTEHGVHLFYGRITFTYHKGVCVNVNSYPTFQLYNFKKSSNLGMSLVLK